MDLKDKQNQLNKARDFIKKGKKGSQIPPADPQPIPVPEKEKSGSKNKKAVAYRLDIDLIKRVQIQAAKNGERPAHFITRAAEKELKSQQEEA